MDEEKIKMDAVSLDTSLASEEFFIYFYLLVGGIIVLFLFFNLLTCGKRIVVS